MVENGIGSVLVVEPIGEGAHKKERLAGIITERDATRAIAQHGADALALPVEQLMTKEVVTCGPNDDAEVMEGRMSHGRFRHMPVLHEDGTIAGVISTGDITKARLDDVAYRARQLEAYITGGQPAT